MRIWNLTPHTMHYDDGHLQSEFPSDGIVRLDQSSIEDAPIDGLRIVTTRYGALHGLPTGIQESDIVIVSTLVGDNWPIECRPNGIIVLVPDTGATCKRDENGRIISVKQFIRK
jgi:hypothetical protein